MNLKQIIVSSILGFATLCATPKAQGLESKINIETRQNVADEKPIAMLYYASPELDSSGALSHEDNMYSKNFNVASKRASSFEGIVNFVKYEISRGSIPSVLIIGFHGEPKSMETSRDSINDFRVLEDEIGITNYDEELRKLGEILPDSSTIVLKSCSTGKECEGYNVAEAINKLTKKRVLAPAEDVLGSLFYVGPNDNGRIYVLTGKKMVEYNVSTNEFKLSDLSLRMQFNFFLSGWRPSRAYKTEPDTAFDEHSRRISHEEYTYKGKGRFAKETYEETLDNF